MGDQNCQLHVVFFPFLAPGEIIPNVDLAKLLASRGARATIVTTTLNAPLVSNAIQRRQELRDPINLRVIKFPSAEAGLPENCESVNSLPSPDLVPLFFGALVLLRPQLEDVLTELRPNCLIADKFYPWTNDVAAKFGIPRILYFVTSSFCQCAFELVDRYKPHEKVSSDTEPFVIPHLPGEIKLTRLQLPEHVREKGKTELSRFIEKVNQSERDCYGVVVNSFNELEPIYTDLYKSLSGKKIWQIGPVSLCNQDPEEKSQRGMKSSIDKHECLQWLDSKTPNSVIYVSFGSLASFSSSQLMEIATGLESSGQNFIWVAKTRNLQEDEDWLPEGFEQRMQGKGLIVRGWAPQVLILEHEAIGGFLTHSGAGSVLEAVSAGVPMVTWPIFGDHFYNEKLVTDVLKIGVSVGAKKWVRFVGDFVNRESVEKTVRMIMEGEKGEQMRSRATELSMLARMAVAEGGSSYNDLNALIQELKSLRA